LQTIETSAATELPSACNLLKLSKLTLFSMHLRTLRPYRGAIKTGLTRAGFFMPDFYKKANLFGAYTSQNRQQFLSRETQEILIMSDKQAYEKKLEAQIEEWNADIDKLKAQAKKASADAEADYEKEIDKLESRRDDMNDKLEELKSASEDAWEDVKDGAESAWSSMSDAVSSAASRF